MGIGPKTQFLFRDPFVIPAVDELIERVFVGGRWLWVSVSPQPIPLSNSSAGGTSVSDMGFLGSC